MKRDDLVQSGNIDANGSRWDLPPGWIAKSRNAKCIPAGAADFLVADLLIAVKLPPAWRVKERPVVKKHLVPNKAVECAVSF